MRAALPRLRRFRVADLPQVLAIERASFRADAYPAALFLEYMRRCPGLFLVAEDAGGMVGYSLTCTKGDRAELVSIAVDPRRRRSGAGRALLAGTLRRLRRRGIGRLSLVVKATNRAARRFYESFGFRRVRLVPRYYEDGRDGVLMSLDI